MSGQVYPVSYGTDDSAATRASKLNTFTRSLLEFLAIVPYTAQALGRLLYPRSPAEVSNSVYPVNWWYPYWDVRRHGAVGDGSVDDTAALITTGTASKRVYIDPSLTCLVSSSLAAGLQDDQLWYGGGVIDAGSAPAFTPFSVTTENTVFENLRFVSDGTPTAHFLSFTTGAERSGVRNCTMTGTYSGARLYNAVHCFVCNNNIISPYGWGVNIQTGSRKCLIDGNVITGVQLEHGIYLSGTDIDVTRNVVTNNRITSANLNGIKMIEAVSNLVHGNIVDAAGASSIYVNINARDNVISDNKLTGGDDYGIQVYSMRDTETHDGANNVATLSDSSQAWTTNKFVGETIVNVTDGSSGTITANTATTITATLSGGTDNDWDTGDVYEMWSVVTGNSISGNSISGHASGAMQSNRANTNSFCGNFTNANSVGLHIIHSNNAYAEGNTFQGETTGIDVESGTSNEVGQNKYNSVTTKVVDTATTTIIHERRSGTTSVADGGSITHGHIKTPTACSVTGSVAGEIVTATISGASLVVGIKKHDGTAGTTQNVSWTVTG